MAYDLIVFDWDGTLMDSIGTIVKCAQRALSDLDLPAAQDQDIRDLVGLRLMTIAGQLTGGGADLQERFVETYSYHWRHTFHGDAMPVGAAGATLEQLESRGQMMAVATGKSRRGLESDFDRMDFRRFFATSRTVDESPSKPSPAMLLEIMDELGTRPASTLMVGDTTHDVLMAVSAGVPAVGVLTGSHDADRLRSAGAVVCLEHIGQLVDWLDGRG